MRQAGRAGKSEPIALFEVGSVVASLGGGDRVDGLESALVGRDRELRLVKELFHGTDEAGRPCVLVLQGEAGVGKSRLAWEFEKYVDGRSATEVGAPASLQALVSARLDAQSSARTATQ